MFCECNMFPFLIFCSPNLLISLQPTKILPFHQKNGIASNDTSKRDFCAKTLVGFSSSVQYIDFPFLFNIFIAYSECSVVVYSPPSTIPLLKLTWKLFPVSRKLAPLLGKGSLQGDQFTMALFARHFAGTLSFFPVANLPFSSSWESGTCGQGGFFSIFH